MHRRKVTDTKKYGDVKMSGRKIVWTEKCPDEEMRDKNIPLRKNTGRKNADEKCGRKNTDEKMSNEK